MPKLLSRSKHEEFESNSAFHIRDQKEKRAENTKKMEPTKFGSCEHCSSCNTIHNSAIVHLLFYALMFLLQFFVSSKFVLVIAFSFGFYCNFPCSKHI